MAETDIADIDLERMPEEDVMELIKAALDRLTPARLSEVVEAVEEMRSAKEVEVKEALLAEFRERAAEAGLSFDALFGARRTRRGVGQAVAAKYRGPNGETWSGRGRQPNWLTALEATGRNKEEFRIKEDEGKA